MPDPSDLSPLVAVFQEHGTQQHFSAYGPLWSELLSCMVYETFQNIDLTDKNKVQELGHGIRDLFLRTSSKNGSRLTLDEILQLCDATEVSSGPLERVYRFDKFEEDNNQVKAEEEDDILVDENEQGKQTEK
jgi:hypothetical protein